MRRPSDGPRRRPRAAHAASVSRRTPEWITQRGSMGSHTPSLTIGGGRWGVTHRHLHFGPFRRPAVRWSVRPSGAARRGGCRWVLQCKHQSIVARRRDRRRDGTRRVRACARWDARHADASRSVTRMRWDPNCVSTGPKTAFNSPEKTTASNSFTI